MKKVLKNSLYALAVASVLFTSCKDKDPDPVPETNQYDITENITDNTTWVSGKTYILKKRIAVEAGAELTIEPGVIVKGDAGTGANATALIIAKGGKINARGTQSSPIIFTSIADNIEPGQIKSPNLDASYSGLWGGLIVLGNAPISADNDVMQIEGIPASDLNGQYGGADEADNSGVLEYISIRHGGANIGEGNEINGLTLGGVGNGTTINYIEVISNQDDGIEFFGGCVNVNNLVVWGAGDDAIDVDQGWYGTLYNFAVVCGGTDHGLEIDGPEGVPFTQTGTVKKGTIKGDTEAELADFRKSASGTYSEIFFFNFPNPADDRGDFSLSSGSDLTFQSGLLNFMSLETVLPASVDLDEVFKEGTDAHAMNVPAGSNTVGAEKTAFDSWTLTAASGELDDF